MPKVPKVPKSMLVKDVASTIKKLFSECDEKWDGKLYRAGHIDGSYFHTSREGAQYYVNEEHGSVEEFPLPVFSNAIVIDFDNDRHMNFLYALMGVEPFSVDDISTLIDDARQPLKELGFDCLIIFGETGAQVEGVPVEVVKL